METHNGSSVGQFFKVWWMGAWRASAFLAITADHFYLVMAACAAFAFTLVFLGHKTVRIWPLFNLLFRFRNPLLLLKRRPPYRRSPRRVASPEAKIDYIPKATTKGLITGFEPRALENMPLQRSPWIVGNPGFGLNASGFDRESIKAGQKGEENFAKALQKTGLIDKFQSYWSVYLPDRENFVRTREYETDVDCVIFNGRVVYLVDLKNYKSGAITYKSEGNRLYAIDDASKAHVQVSSKMSRNMEMAQELFRKHLEPRGYRVEARVVLMPQNSGQATVDRVYWPGGIRAMVLTDFLAELQNTDSFRPGNHDFFHTGMLSLVK